MEEKMMLEYFGDKYVEYCRDKYRLISYVY